MAYPFQKNAVVAKKQQVLSVSEAATHLGLDIPDVYKLVRDGWLNGQKVADKWQFYYYQVETCRRRLQDI